MMGFHLLLGLGPSLSAALRVGQVMILQLLQLVIELVELAELAELMQLFMGLLFELYPVALCRSSLMYCSCLSEDTLRVAVGLV